MRLIPMLGWGLVGKSVEPLDARLLPLLNAVAKSDSLAAAVNECGISYRAAWGLLRDYHVKIGSPLVLLERGRGATLTAAGQQLVMAQRTATRRLETVLPGLGVELAVEMGVAEEIPPLRLHIAASHDLVLESLAANLRQFATGLEIETSFMGSLLALKEFSQGHADAAGFHVPTGGKLVWERAPFLRWLRQRTDKLIRFIDRDQGLILPRGNPSRVKNFRDIARGGLRFVNRQRDSGSRLLIDRLISEAGVLPSALNGYVREEFTHGAVAATIASGGADAGFGLRAAAAEYGLDFVPMVRERYYLAVRENELDSAPIVRLLELLRSPAFNRHVRNFPGCIPAEAGTVVSPDALSST